MWNPGRKWSSSRIGPRWRCFRRVVARAGRVQGVEYSRLCRAQLFAAAGQHDVLRAILDSLVGITNAHAARGAGNARRVYASLQTKIYTDIDGCCVSHHADVGCRRYAVEALVDEHASEVGNSIGAAGRRSICHADSP